MVAGPGDADVEEAAFFLDLFIGLGVRDRHHAFGETDEEDGVPFEAFGGVQGGEGDAFDGGCVLGGGAFVEFGDEVGEGGGGFGAGEVLGEAYEGGEGFPAFTDGSGAVRGWLVQPSPERTARTWEGRSTASSRRESLFPKRAALRRAWPALRTSARSKKRSAPRSW